MTFNFSFFFVLLCLIITQIFTLSIGATPHRTSDGTMYVLEELSNSPVNTSAGVSGLYGCSKSIDQIYMICGSLNNVPVKFSLSPISFLVKGKNGVFGDGVLACELYDTNDISTSVVACAKYQDESSSFQGVIFYHATTLEEISRVYVNGTYGDPRIAIDNSNRLVFFAVSQFVVAETESFIAVISIPTSSSEASKSTSMTTSLHLSDDNDYNYQYSSLLVRDGFLFTKYQSLSDLYTSKLLRFNILASSSKTTLELNSSVNFPNQITDSLGMLLRANENAFLYNLDLCGTVTKFMSAQHDPLVFVEFLETNPSMQWSTAFSVSPDGLFLVVSIGFDGLAIVNATSFEVDGMILSTYRTDDIFITTVPSSVVIVPSENATIVHCTSLQDTTISSFLVSVVPRLVAIPVLYPLPGSPFNIGYDNYFGPSSCSPSFTDDSYAICSSPNGKLARFTLSPLSLAVQGVPSPSNESMQWCDLFDTGSLSTSIFICPVAHSDALPVQGRVRFFAASSLEQLREVLLSDFVGSGSHVAVDLKNATAYVSNFGHPSWLYKIVNIDSSSPRESDVILLVGIGANVLTIVDNFVYVGNIVPDADWYIGQILRVNLTAGVYNASNNESFVIPDPGEDLIALDGLSYDEMFLYVLTLDAIIVRCVYSSSKFEEFGPPLITGMGRARSLVISFDHKFLFVAALEKNLLYIIDVKSFELYGTPATVNTPYGKPVVTPEKTVYAFSFNSPIVAALSYACNAFPKKECLQTEQCTFCDKAQRCIDKTDNTICTCALGTSTSCNMSLGCFWCGSPNISYYNRPAHSINLCIELDSSKSISSQQCSCAFLPKEICQQPDVPCRWCDQIGVCLDPNRYLSSRCSTSSSSSSSAAALSAPSTCVNDCDLCTWNEAILLGVTDPQPYCAVNSHEEKCTSPIACNTINLATSFDVERQCKSAGCRYPSDSKLCENQQCFAFFIPGYYLIPFALLFLGFFKDVAVLLIIGFAADCLSKRIKGCFMWWTFCKKGWDCQKIQTDLAQTVYVNDAKFRDDVDEDESFEGYCQRMMQEVFEVPLIEYDDEENNKLLRKVLDSITFTLFDTGLWFELKDEKLGDNKVSDSETCAAPSNSQATLNDDVEDLLFSSETTKTILTVELINNRSKLQKTVETALTKRATNVIFYASSRDKYIRAALSLNSFPSSVQLMLYLALISFLVVTSLLDVLANDENRNIIRRMATFGCGDSSSQNSTNSTVTNSSSVSTSYDGVSERKSTYFLLGFRMMNSSTLATIMLLVVKTIRALWADSGDRFFRLNLPQRLPIMGLFTSNLSKLLLCILLIFVSPFAFIGITYGLKMVPCIVVVFSAIGLLLFDALILHFVRRSLEKHEDTAGSSGTTQEEVSIPQEQAYGTFLEDDTPTQDVKRKKVVSEPWLKKRSSSRRSAAQLEKETASSPEFYDNLQPPLPSIAALSQATIAALENLETDKHSITNSAPTELGKAIIVFLLTEEIPTIILTLALQMTFNYVCLMEYRTAFGIADESEVPSREFGARTVSCVWASLEEGISSKLAYASAFVPFM